MNSSAHAYMVVGLAYGDEGKGSITDFLCREHAAKLVVRFNGGSQVSHTVVLADGTHHCFSQFGSGAFAGAQTYLSRFMLVEPFALLHEAKILSEKLGRSAMKDLYIEEGCPIITPFHWLANQARQRKDQEYGSCGKGIGELRSDQVNGEWTLRAGNLQRWNWLEMYTGLQKLRDRKCLELEQAGCDCEALTDESLYSLLYFYERAGKAMRIVPNGTLKSLIDGPVVFEGAQGVLLDETYGQEPYNTWTDTTFLNADKLLDGVAIKRTRIGVVRSYFTRHGAGPFVTESSLVNHPEPHNPTGPWQGPFRQGFFDAVAVRYAIKCCGGVDALAVTHLDRVSGSFAYSDCEIGSAEPVFSYRPCMFTRRDPFMAIEEAVGRPIYYVSRGPSAAEKEISEVGTV